MREWLLLMIGFALGATIIIACSYACQRFRITCFETCACCQFFGSEPAAVCPLAPCCCDDWYEFIRAFERDNHKKMLHAARAIADVLKTAEEKLIEGATP
jgi:hypothetical protein